MYDEEKLQQLEQIVTETRYSIKVLNEELVWQKKKLKENRRHRYIIYAFWAWTIFLLLISYGSNFSLVLNSVALMAYTLFLRENGKQEEYWSNSIEGLTMFIAGLQATTEEAQFALIAMKEGL